MPLFALDHVSHSYGSVSALRDVTLQVEPGTIGLIGQNGAGKSTLLKILLGLIRPTQGRSQVLGCDVGSEARELRGRVGFMPEADALIPDLYGVDLVALAGELCGMPRKQALRRAHEVLSYLDLGEVRYRPCGGYSVGMKQRLKLAAALVHDPELLLLDEPTAGLDPDGRDDMLNLLQSLARRHGKSLILSTHLLGDIDRVCEQVLIVHRGTVRGMGRIGDLRAQFRGLYRLSWRGLAAGFLDQLQSAGVLLRSTDSTDAVLVETPSDWAVRRFYEIAANCNVILRDIVPQEEDLEDLYHRVIQAA
ncbi:MAG: ABC transporter ATP-binding protein [Planctomycetes bacterium]|nr:ABC transporter ATP-binding protein [Planctomycetota bacterium]